MPSVSSMKDDQPIYVINRTGKYIKDKQGRPHTTEYVLELHKANGRSSRIVIPATKFPYLLSNVVPASMLRESPEFLTLVERGILELVPADRARELLSDPMARQAMDHAMRRLQPTVHQPIVPKDIAKLQKRQEEDLEDEDIDQKRPQDPILQLAPADDDDADVSIAIKSIVTDLDNDPSLKDEKLLELYNMDGLTDDDLGFLMANCRAGNIKRWARDELAKRVGEESANELESDLSIAANADDEDEPTPRVKRLKKIKRHRK
jgi:hypothetical protein